jgi:hypothetical protein
LVVVIPFAEVVGVVRMTDDVVTSSGVIVTVVAVDVLVDAVVEGTSDKTVMMPFIVDG